MSRATFSTTFPSCSCVIFTSMPVRAVNAPMFAAAAELGAVFSEMKFSFAPLYCFHMSAFARAANVGLRYQLKALPAYAAPAAAAAVPTMKVLRVVARCMMFWSGPAVVVCFLSLESILIDPFIIGEMALAISHRVQCQTYRLCRWN